MELENLYDEQVGKVYKFFYIHSLNKSVAEDLTSQTFMVLIDKARITKIEDPKKYLYGIMRNIWLEYLREKYETLASDIEAIDDFDLHVEDDVEDFSKKEVHDRLKTYVDRLPQAQAKIIYLRHYEEQAPKQIAELLGKDMNYVKVTYKRALKSLRVLIESPSVLYETERNEV